MSDALDQARELLTRVRAHNASTDTSPALIDLTRAVAAMLEHLEGHQHSYFGPADMHGKWATTGEHRNTGVVAHAQYLKQQADKKKATS